MSTTAQRHSHQQTNDQKKIEFVHKQPLLDAFVKIEVHTLDERVQLFLPSSLRCV
jgi:hypothetical protein